MRFLPNGDSAGIELGLVRPSDYNQNDPDLATSIYVFGDPINGPNSSLPVIIGFPNSAGAAVGAPIPEPNPNLDSWESGGGPYLVPETHDLSVPASEVGATWALAYDRYNQTVYAAAYTKKYAGYGPGGNGAIYQMGTSGSTATVFADLNRIFGLGTTGVDFRGTPTWAAQGGYFTDGFNTGWDAVGKSSLGGMAVSDDGANLYVVNLAVYILPTNGPLNSTTVQRIPIPNPITAATSTDADLDFRPFAVAVHDGRV